MPKKRLCKKGPKKVPHDTRLLLFFFVVVVVGSGGVGAVVVIVVVDVDVLIVFYWDLDDTNLWRLLHWKQNALEIPGRESRPNNPTFCIIFWKYKNILALCNEAIQDLVNPPYPQTHTHAHTRNTYTQKELD